MVDLGFDGEAYDDYAKKYLLPNAPRQGHLSGHMLMQIAAVAWQGETAAAERTENRLGGSIAPRPRPGKKRSTIFVRRAHEDLLPQAVRLEAVRVGRVARA